MFFICLLDIAVKFIHVNWQTVFAIKSFVTNTAIIHKLSGKMNSLYMFTNIVFLSIYFATECTREGPCRNIFLDVVIQSAWVH